MLFVKKLLLHCQRWIDAQPLGQPEPQQQAPPAVHRWLRRCVQFYSCCCVPVTKTLGLTTTMHVLLQVGESQGKPAYEPVHVESLGERRFTLLFTPGLAYGVAADDVIEVAEDGSYEVLTRGRNVAVQVFTEQPAAEIEDGLTDKVQSELGGRLDGKLMRALAYTVPIETGFESIEVLFNDLVGRTPGVIWEYGNVYAANGEPIGWWHSEA